VAGPAVELVNASKRYGDVLALDGVSIAINPGEVVAMLGPNGAGKTTAVRILTTLLVADGGRAFIDGIDVFAIPASELVMRLDQKCRYDRGTDEYSYIFHDWELALWRPAVPSTPDDEEGRYFSTISIGIRGYFEGRSD